MNVKLKRLLLPLLRAVKEGKPISFRMRSAAQQALFHVQRGIKKPSQGRLRRVSKRSTKNEETAKIREAVGKRSGGYCEVAGCTAHAHALDHWLGGSGRRCPAQSIETCWYLCFHCNAMRTANTPTAAFWNARFREHCDRYGYPVYAHIVHEPVRRAQ